MRSRTRPLRQFDYIQMTIDSILQNPLARGKKLKNRFRFSGLRSVA
eukprot:COSAG06_NODE_45827_length_351_cov_2.238095_1_plen_45_part_01